MLDGSLFFFTTVNDFPLSIPPATGYFSVRILPLHTIYTTATLNRTIKHLVPTKPMGENNESDRSWY